MRILLTGATGFIGEHVLNTLLEANHTVYAISRKPPRNNYWYQADILKSEEINKIIQDVKADTLIHLAWDVTHGEFWKGTNNKEYAEATKSLLDFFIKRGGRKVIATGTCAEYPMSSEAVSETVDYGGDLTPYGAAKKSVYDYLSSTQKKEPFDFTWLRIFGIYGPGENKERFFPKSIHSIKYKIPFEVKNPSCYVDYVYVKALANFIEVCLQRNNLGAINIGTGRSISISDLHNTLKRYIEDGVLEIQGPIDKPSPNSRIPDCTKLISHGFKFELLDGLQETTQYFS
jgi:nucleoside-diphosphate-sugar epimerase